MWPFQCDPKTGLTSECYRRMQDPCPITHAKGIHDGDNIWHGDRQAVDEHATEDGHELRLYVCDSPNITAVLKMSGIAERLTIVAALDEALLNAPRPQCRGGRA